MNTRLQVEHPVTELVTGIDLVREQIRVAAGEKLSFRQEDIRLDGHAIECRIYAEDPETNFMPSPGTIDRLRVPQGPGVRDDGGVFTGTDVSIYYDPMISKLSVHGRSRSEAIDKMRRALMEYEVVGIKTTLQFFRDVMIDPEFIDGTIDTGFIPRFFDRESRVNPDDATRDLALIAAALASAGKAKTGPAIAPENREPSRWARSARLNTLRGGN